MSRGSVPLFALLAVVLGCAAPTEKPTPSPTPPLGGTLKIGVVGGLEDLAQFVLSDPAFPTRGELLRCCLARTLLTYPGRPTVDGGAALQADLAVALPTVSADGKSWTFELRHGIHYAPPYDGVEVTAADFVRAMERDIRLSPDLAQPGFPFAFLQGAAEFAAGAATTINGLEAPDRYTLVIRSTQPYGGLQAVADVAWAPIPEALVADHGDDLGRYWASTGPYMYESYATDPPATTLVLVRNPSWDRATDPRRGAWVDRIEISLVAESDDPFVDLDDGLFDFVSVAAPGNVVARYRADTAGAKRLRSTSSETLFFLPMNLAVPPFDDPAVRRAVNAVLNRDALADIVVAARSTFGPQRNGLVIGHVFPDSLTEGLLVDYDPFPSRGHSGDIGRARQEMSSSRYDSNADGACDAQACKGIAMPAADAALGEAVRADLARIGIEVNVVELTDANRMEFVRNHTALAANIFGWGYGLAGDDLAFLLYRGDAGLVDQDGATFNMSLVGARPADLADWGYSVPDVPDVDDVVERCLAATAHLRARCWAELDQLITEVVVPWVPIFSFETAHVASSRVADFAIDQSIAYPALDNVILAGQP